MEAAIGQETIESYEAARKRLLPDERETIVTRVEFGLTPRLPSSCRDSRGQLKKQ
jgi:hypothetical protein